MPVMALRMSMIVLVLDAADGILEEFRWTGEGLVMLQLPPLNLNPAD